MTRHFIFALIAFFGVGFTAPVFAKNFFDSAKDWVQKAVHDAGDGLENFTGIDFDWSDNINPAMTLFRENIETLICELLQAPQCSVSSPSTTYHKKQMIVHYDGGFARVDASDHTAPKVIEQLPNYYQPILTVRSPTNTYPDDVLFGTLQAMAGRFTQDLRIEMAPLQNGFHVKQTPKVHEQSGETQVFLARQNAWDLYVALHRAAGGVARSDFKSFNAVYEGMDLLYLYDADEPAAHTPFPDTRSFGPITVVGRNTELALAKGYLCDPSGFVCGTREFMCRDGFHLSDSCD